MTSDTATCARCGIQRTVKVVTTDYLCMNCATAVRHVPSRCTRCGRARRADNKHTNLCGNCAREPEHVLALADGQWVRDGLVYRWQPGPPPPEPNICGTERGYDRHCKRGEPTCADCKEAHRVHRATERHPHREDAA